MNKSRFIEKAPSYYALAICVFFRGSPQHVAHKYEIKAGYHRPETNEEEEGNFLECDVLFEQAMEWLTKRQMIECILDDFGPPIYKQLSNLEREWEALAYDNDFPFSKFVSIGEPRSWLLNALDKLNATYAELGISEVDFESPDKDWEPLPLDRDATALQTAIRAIDGMVEQVRADNGYNAAIPEERNYVLESLSRTAKTLKESGSISVAYIRSFAIEPLAILARRFKGAALGIAATAAKEAIIEWLKEVGVAVLKDIF